MNRPLGLTSRESPKFSGVGPGACDHVLLRDVDQALRRMARVLAILQGRRRSEA